MADEKAPTQKLTVRRKILLAAASLPEGGFTIEDLVVRAWTLYPESFSLTGHPYPDSGRVQPKLCGRDGLRGLGWVESPSQRVLVVTKKGLRVARQIAGHTARTSTRTPRPRARPAAIPREQAPPIQLDEADVKAVILLASSQAMRKFSRAGRLTQEDAESFWQKREPAETEAVLNRVLLGFRDGKASDPRLPPLSTCRSLELLHRFLCQRFGAREVSSEASHP